MQMPPDLIAGDGLDPEVRAAALGPWDTSPGLARALATLDWDIPAAPYRGCDHHRKCLTAGQHHELVRSVLRGPWGAADPLP